MTQMQPDTARPLLVFSHANGFPAPTYNKLFRLLEGGARVRAVDRFGHDPRYPVRDGWQALSRQLIDFLLQDCGGEPAVLVGHSLGGYLSLMAAHARPDLVRQVILLDSPVVSGWRSQVLWLSKRTGWGERFSPAGAARRRRTQWTDLQAAHAHFAAKEVFRPWDAEMLDDYVRHGTADSPEGRSLTFTREVEYRIYTTLPHRLGRMTRRPFPVPVTFIGGTDSREIRMAGLAATRRLTRGRMVRTEGTHLFPFEHPAETARLILESIAQMQTKPPSVTSPSL